MGPQYKGVQQDSKQAQDKCVTSVVEQMGHLSPERPSFPFNADRKQWCFKKYK